MFALEVGAPTHRILKILSTGLKVLDSLCVGHPLETTFDDVGQSLEQFWLDALVEELKIGSAVVQSVLNCLPKELLGEVHVAFKRTECHLRLDHPELGKVAARGRILSSEGRSKCVDVGESQREGFSIQLAAHGQIRRFAKEVVCRVFANKFVAVVTVLHRRGDLEHRAGSFAVAGRDDWSVDVVEAALVEELVNGLRKLVPHPENRTERVPANPKVRLLAQKLHRRALLLQGVGERICFAKDFQGGSLEFDGLPCRWRFYNDTRKRYA